MNYSIAAKTSLKENISTHIADVELFVLTAHHDQRGSLTEVMRTNWTTTAPVQWNVVHSTANVLRGVHGHRLHDDYLTVAARCAIFGLHDLRPASPTFKVSQMITVDARQPRAIRIPTGVAHGFYFPVTSTLIYGVTRYWDGSDEFGCRFNDPALGLTWPTDAPLLSATDQRLGDYDNFLAAFSTGDADALHKARLKR